ncbi:MAG TPA: hypothetical protein GXZ30_13055 [Propionibacterium sp.]|nr:hypothetical protein [Propionibacterium sp.]
MNQGPADPGDATPRWPTYPAGPDFLAPGEPSSPPPPERDPGAQRQPAYTSPPLTQPRPVQPPLTRPQPKGPIIALVATLAALVLFVVLGLGSVLWLRTATVTDLPPTDPPGQDPIPAAPPGAPAEGPLREQLEQEFGTFEPIVRSGTGPAEIELPPESRRALLWAKTDGNGWFSVKGVAENGNTAPLFYSGDATEGTVGFGLRDYALRPTRLLVESTSADWEIEVRPVASAPVFTGEASGTGMAVLIVDGPARDVQLDYRGEANFIVVQHGLERSTHHANEIGSTSIEATLAEGTGLLEIEAWRNGQWGIRER